MPHNAIEIAGLTEAIQALIPAQGTSAPHTHPESEVVNLVTDLSGKLTATYAGTYRITMAISMQNSGTNKHMEYGVSVNGASPTMYQREFFAAVSEEQHGSLTRIITLTAGQTIELAVRTTDTGTPNLLVDNLSITAEQIGA